MMATAGAAAAAGAAGAGAEEAEKQRNGSHRRVVDGREEAAATAVAKTSSFTSDDEELLSEMGGEVLRKMEASAFFRENPSRVIPTFEKSEMGFGRRLGVGSFCSANEIIAIALKRDDDDAANANGGHEHAPNPASTPASAEFDREQHDGHYDMSPSEARSFMEAHHLRDGDARYAVKRLKPDLSAEERLKGTLDLAIECKFLSALNHPNIVKMRGKAAGDPLRPTFFLVLDRLYDTLEERAYRWRERRDAPGAGGGGCLCFGGGGKKKSRHEEVEFLLERVTVAYDISSVFRFLHGHNLIYRDIKPDNVGFDVRNDIKVFDFGLCKELSPDERTDDGLYRMSGLTGCLDFMAPEVALSQPYDLSADVYSFGILLWEIMSLEVPYHDIAQEDLVEKVVKGGHRPTVDPSWPVQIRELIKECWSEDIRSRPDFEQVASLLKATLMAETGSAAVRDRTQHMKDRSQHSFRGLMHRR